MTALRLAIVSDIHHGAVSWTKRGPDALRLLDTFLANAAREGVDALVDLGDRISDVDPDTDAALLDEVAQRFRASNLPRHHVCGNHDRDHLDEAANARGLGTVIGNRVADLGPVRAVFWQPSVTLRAGYPPRLAPGDLDRLRAMLDESERRTLLFSHVPLSGQSMAGNFWFENNPDLARYRETADIRRVLAEAPCPIVAIAGHVHWNSVTTVDGIPHVTCQSLVESFTTGGAACGASGILTIEGERLTWRVGGADPFEAAFPFRAEKARWTAPLPPFPSEPVAADHTDHVG